MQRQGSASHSERVAEEWTQHLLCGKDLQSALLCNDLRFCSHRTGVCGRRRSSWTAAHVCRHCTQQRRRGVAWARSHHVVQLNAGPRRLQDISRSTTYSSAAGACSGWNNTGNEVPADYAVLAITAATTIKASLISCGSGTISFCK